jgi:hypothetical protein
MDVRSNYKIIQYLFMINTLNILETEGNFFNLIKGMSEKPTVNTSHLTMKDLILP